MKRSLLAAIAAIVTLGAVVATIRTHAPNIGDAYAQNAPVVVAPASGKPLPEASVVDQDAPYHEACAREGLSESECVGRLIWFKATGGNERFHP